MDENLDRIKETVLKILSDDRMITIMKAMGVTVAVGKRQVSKNYGFVRMDIVIGDVPFDDVIRENDSICYPGLM